MQGKAVSSLNWAGKAGSLGLREEGGCDTRSVKVNNQQEKARSAALCILKKNSSRCCAIACICNGMANRRSRPGRAGQARSGSDTETSETGLPSAVLSKGEEMARHLLGAMTTVSRGLLLPYTTRPHD